MGDSKTAPHHRRLDCSAEQALFSAGAPETRLDGFIATFHANERPLQGLSGMLDWHFHGVISQFLRSGAILGEAGERAYLPVTRGGRVFHLFLLGAGNSSFPGARHAFDAHSAHLSQFAKAVAALRIQRLGISRSDFGDPARDDSPLLRHLKEVPLWIVP